MHTTGTGKKKFATAKAKKGEKGEQKTFKLINIDKLID